jgi:hypothetical protein
MLPDIVPDTPVVIEAKEEKVYSKLWLQRLIVEAASPSKPITVYIELVPNDGNGNTLTSPITHNTIPNAFLLAAQDPQFAQVLGGVIMMANKYKSVNFNEPFEIDPKTYEVIQPIL